MLDGFLFFWPHCPLHKQKTLQKKNTPPGPVLGFSHCIWAELTFCSKVTYSHGTLMPSFSPNHFQPSLVCSKMLAIFLKSLILLLSAWPRLLGVKGRLGEGCTVPGNYSLPGRFLTSFWAKEHGGQDFKRNELLSFSAYKWLCSFIGWLKCVAFLLLTGKAALMLTLKEITKESEMLCWRTFRVWR